MQQELNPVHIDHYNAKQLVKSIKEILTNRKIASVALQLTRSRHGKFEYTIKCDDYTGVGLSEHEIKILLFERNSVTLVSQNTTYEIRYNDGCETAVNRYHLQDTHHEFLPLDRLFDLFLEACYKLIDPRDRHRLDATGHMTLSLTHHTHLMSLSSHKDNDEYSAYSVVNTAHPSRLDAPFSVMPWTIVDGNSKE